MTTTCRTCTRPWDPDEEPSGDRERCPDCVRLQSIDREGEMDARI